MVGLWQAIKSSHEIRQVLEAQVLVGRGSFPNRSCRASHGRGSSPFTRSAVPQQGIPALLSGRFSAGGKSTSAGISQHT